MDMGVGKLESSTFWVITMEQTMQARRLRCWPGGTKFSDTGIMS